MRSVLSSLSLIGALMLSLSSPAFSADDKSTFFNGKDFEGWEGLLKEYWSIKDGAIVAQYADGTVEIVSPLEQPSNSAHQCK